MSMMNHPVVHATRGMESATERIAEINRVMAEEGMFMCQFYVLHLKGKRYLVEAWRHNWGDPLGIIKRLRP